MTDNRNPDNAAIRFLVDEFRSLRTFVENHCRDEEKSNSNIFSAISEIRGTQESFKGDIGEIKSDLKPLVSKVAVHDKEIEHLKEVRAQPVAEKKLISGQAKTSGGLSQS